MRNIKPGLTAVSRPRQSCWKTSFFN